MLYQNDPEEKRKLFSKVSDAKEEDWDEDYIHFIRELSENAYGMNLRERVTEPFGFFMVYQYAVKFQTEFALS